MVKNAIARAKLKQVDHFVDFDASATSNAVNVLDNTIGFRNFS